MSELGKKVLARLRESGLSDEDQRSAIGLARTWVEKRKPIKRSDIDGYQKRDDLAVALVDILEESAAAPDRCVAALKEARASLNRPFLDPTLLGAKRLELVKPKEGGN